ncbi:MAG: DUF1043 family protein [Alcanivoracaceae bacterium]|nr:DUF1043 family protein [Alcanivoracaceae bacterium]
MTDQIFYLFSAVLLGLVIGALIMYFISGSNKDPKEEIAKVEDKLNTYQKNVSQHFEQTADLIDELTQSYKKVFDHLGESARELMTDEQIQIQIEKRRGNKVTLEFLTDAVEPEVEQVDIAEIDEMLENIAENDIQEQASSSSDIAETGEVDGVVSATDDSLEQEYATESNQVSGDTKTSKEHSYT